MDPDAICWYAEPGDPPGEDAVLLIGGYQGFANFGDLLQVKGVARWHREVTGLRPVPVLSLTAVADPEFTPRVRAGLGVDQVLYWSERPVDAAAAGLAELRRVPRVPHLHVYGGECFSGRWVDLYAALIESAHRRFGVGHYVLSGQQADAAAVPAMRAYFERRAPVLAGGRDPESAAQLRRGPSTGAALVRRRARGHGPARRRGDGGRAAPAGERARPPQHLLLHAGRGRGARRRPGSAGRRRRRRRAPAGVRRAPRVRDHRHAGDRGRARGRLPVRVLRRRRPGADSRSPSTTRRFPPRCPRARGSRTRARTT